MLIQRTVATISAFLLLVVLAALLPDDSDPPGRASDSRHAQVQLRPVEVAPDLESPAAAVRSDSQSPHNSRGVMRLAAHNEPLPQGNAGQPVSSVRLVPMNNWASTPLVPGPEPAVRLVAAAQPQKPTFDGLAVTIADPEDSRSNTMNLDQLNAANGKLNGEYRKHVVSIQFNVHGVAQGNIEVRKRNGARIGELISLPAAGNVAKTSFDVSEVANQGDVAIEFVAYIEGFPDPFLIDNLNLNLNVDTMGPKLVRAELDGAVVLPESSALISPKILLAFQDNDLSVIDIEQFSLYRVERYTDTGSTVPYSPGSARIKMVNVFGIDKQVIELGFDKLDYGVYRVTIPTAVDANGAKFLRDKHGNVAGGFGKTGASQEQIVEVFAPRPAGKVVEFPEFLPTAPQPVTERRINPADKVETAVVRLYYYRDAHRVAQLINRNVRPLNHAAVTQAEQRAAKARQDADELTIKRRAAEREAVREAEDLRRAETKLSDARKQSQEARSEKAFITRQMQLNREEIDRLKEQLNLQQSPASPIETPPGDSAKDEEFVGQQRGVEQLPVSWLAANGETSASADPAAKFFTNALPGTIESRINELERANLRLQSQLTEIEKVTEDTVLLEGTVNTLRQRAQDSNEVALALNESEELAKRNQFQAEVAAAHEDPDTFAPAVLHTVDPVAQVSISVIGEGLIQLRGPSKGIDAIRTMVNQIDAPVGQVKVDVISVQVNGEDGAKMEGPVGKIDAQLKIARSLTSHSLMLLRGAIQMEATQIATEEDQGGHYQIDRDRKYLYGFFGRDFIDELYEMDSEFLNTENKVLGLHSMDTISLHQALFVLALAKNDVRQRILANFMRMVRDDLVQAEFDMHRAAEVFPHKTRFWRPHHSHHHREEFALEGIALNNAQRYHFTSLMNFFGSLECGGFGAAEGSSNTLNPVQREFLRLAQIFKSRLVAELELKQRLIERTMIEDKVLNEINDEEVARNSLRPRVLELSRKIQDERLTAAQKLVDSKIRGEIAQVSIRDSLRKGERETQNSLDTLTAIVIDETDGKKTEMGYLNFIILSQLRGNNSQEMRQQFEGLRQFLSSLRTLALFASPRTASLQSLLKEINELEQICIDALNAASQEDRDSVNQTLLFTKSDVANKIEGLIRSVLDETNEFWTRTGEAFAGLTKSADPSHFDYRELSRYYSLLNRLQDSLVNEKPHEGIFGIADGIYRDSLDLAKIEAQYANANDFLKQTRSSLERRKLLDFLIQEQEEKVIDLLEGTRSRIAALDGYLKRLSVALEDDFQVQFYDPAFVRIRGAARNMNVTFGQVERTSVLTNNRAFAKVSPQATMEFDLPKRDIAVVEALDGAKALAEDYGALLQDPTFLAAYQLMGGAPSNGKVQNVIPGLPSSGDEQQMGFAPLPDQQSGSSLQSLVPDPSVYKIETGTGYEIRPVIQPDGISVVFDFNYMYTTNVREPVRADEKHLGRVKRHFIDTQVQTTSFEMRRVSRYQVALKVARTSQGVPLLQDIPVMGALFRPAPSDESAIQENIILSQSVVYPTVFDVMGLRWAPSVVDLNHVSVRDSEHVVRGRQQTVKNSVFDNTTRTVDDVLGLNREDSEFYRPDLYHRQTTPSPYHPGGYVHPGVEPDDDPAGGGFMHRDRRPMEMRDPPYDNRRRMPLRLESDIDPEPFFEPAYEELSLEGDTVGISVDMNGR